MLGHRPARPTLANPVLWIGILVYAASYLICYPRTFAIVDEDAYLTQALLFRSGHVSYDGSPIAPPHMTVAVNGRQVSKYPPGNSLFLLPFTLPGWRWVFVSGLLLAVTGTALFAATLRRLAPDVDTGWALLYLCYPAAVLFSRTLMSDLLAATLVLAGFCCLVHGRRWLFLSGCALGSACLVRYTNLVLLPAFAGLAFVHRRRARDTPLLVLGAAPFLVLVALYNSYSYGGPLRFPMYLTGQFAAGFFVRNLGYYVINLLLLYPLMLIGPLAAGRRNLLSLGLPAIALLLPYCFFSYVHETSVLGERLTIGMRYLLPAVPFFLLGYVIAAERLLRRLAGAKAVRLVTFVLMLGLSVALQFRHDRYLRRQGSYRDLLYRSVPEEALLICNGDVSELVSHAWGSRRYRRFVEFNTPIPVASAIDSAGSAYAAYLEKPGRENLIERALYETLLVGWPERSLVVETAAPYRFRVFRLKPAAVPVATP